MEEKRERRPTFSCARSIAYENGPESRVPSPRAEKRTKMLGQLIEKHPGIVGVAIIAGLLILLIRSVIRALQRWEVIPDPLLPERWRRRVNAVEMAALDVSADDRTYGIIAGSLRGGSSSGRKSGSFSNGGGRFGGGGSSGNF